MPAQTTRCGQCPTSGPTATRSGCHLGDGHIVVRAGLPRFMQRCLDSIYPELIEEAAAALERTFPGSRARRYAWGEARREIVQLCNPALLVAFPQHGPGRKHEREIEASRLAARTHPRPPRRPRPRADPLGRLPHDQPLHDQAAERPREAVRLPALLLLRRVGRHPRDLLRARRASGAFLRTQSNRRNICQFPTRRASRSWTRWSVRNADVDIDS